MTKREKILLQICIAIGLIGLSSIYLLKPAIAEKNLQEQNLEAAQLEELQVKTVLEAEGVEETLAEQKLLAEQNYNYFYDKLNSYTIDGILNEIVAECDLEVESMNIGTYTEISTDTLKRTEEEVPVAEETSETSPTTTETEEEEEKFLLGCQVTLNVKGTYNQVLELVDALKVESTCIEVTSISLYADERNIEVEDAVSASLGLLVYGISDAMLEEVN